jgi:hypothetical protein
MRPVNLAVLTACGNSAVANQQAAIDKTLESLFLAERVTRRVKDARAKQLSCHE